MGLWVEYGAVGLNLRVNGGGYYHRYCWSYSYVSMIRSVFF